MIKVNQMLFIVTLLLSTTACAIPRSDVLECGLPDGSKFILTSKYDWDPIAKMLPGHPTTDRTHQSDYIVRLVTVKPKKEVDFVNYAHIKYEYLSTLGIDKELCHRLYSINNNYHIYQYYFSKKRGKVMQVEGNDLIGLSITENENPQKISEVLRAKNLTPIYESFFSETREGYIFEQALTNTEEKCNARLSTDEQCKIVAVARSQLNTSSLTWTEPIITTDAKILELGKTIYEQSFIARPISINGNKIEAHFPPKPRN